MTHTLDRPRRFRERSRVTEAAMVISSPALGGRRASSELKTLPLWSVPENAKELLRNCKRVLQFTPFTPFTPQKSA